MTLSAFASSLLDLFELLCHAVHSIIPNGKTAKISHLRERSLVELNKMMMMMMMMMMTI